MITTEKLVSYLLYKTDFQNKKFIEADYKTRITYLAYLCNVYSMRYLHKPMTDEPFLLYRTGITTPSIKYVDLNYYSIQPKRIFEGEVQQEIVNRVLDKYTQNGLELSAFCKESFKLKEFTEDTERYSILDRETPVPWGIKLESLFPEHNDSPIEWLATEQDKNEE